MGVPAQHLLGGPTEETRSRLIPIGDLAVQIDHADGVRNLLEHLRLLLDLLPIPDGFGNVTQNDRVNLLVVDRCL